MQLDQIRIRFEADDAEGWRKRYEYEQEQEAKRRQITAWAVLIGVTLLTSAIWLLAIDGLMHHLR